MASKKIVVIGSINMDLVTQTQVVPRLGETVLGTSFSTTPGGKGANQAVAAARLKADVTMIGAVGNDSFGKELLSHLENQGIFTENVEPVTHKETGIASITIANHDNSIIVVPGANACVTEELIEKYEDVIAKSDTMLLQLEIPLSAVIKAAELAKKHGIRVILNPAPYQDLPEELLKLVDYITPNEYEAEELLKASNLKNLQEKLIITRGAEGVSYFESGSEKYISSYKVEVVDTTGAGDSFNGAFAVALSEGKTLEEACSFAVAVGALAVTKLGAQSGMPTREQVEAFLTEAKGGKQ